MVDSWTPSADRLFDLSGRVAVVTSATGVLGGAMANGLARAGARVGVTLVWLCSPAARFVTGVVVPVDGDVVG
jgi:NAD(P)-dependent dehydrogenase (short-subunit alcohol dehydrogenase family)